MSRYIDADKFIDLVEDMVDEKYVRNVISLVELAVISEENSCKSKESEEENLTLDDWTYGEYPRESEEEE